MAISRFRGRHPPTLIPIAPLEVDPSCRWGGLAAPEVLIRPADVLQLADGTKSTW